MTRNILLIEDNDNNSEIIEGFLKLGVNSQHGIIKCKNGQEGLMALSKHHAVIDVILLDKMMPVMSGMEFLKKIKTHNEFNKIPIIMQTASTDTQDICESFRLGVYHFLAKPYSPIVFNAVVKGAIDFHTKQVEMQTAVKNTKTLFKYVNQASFKIRDLVDANTISTSLASLFPYPEKVILGISEILTNAIEHGNLKITYEEKTDLNLQSKWQEEIDARLNLPENKEKFVTIDFEKCDDKMILHVKDQGDGFEYQKYLDFDASRAMDNHGRGIAFANHICFDHLEYLGQGNEVRCIVKKPINSPAVNRL
ncbi:MAG: response regulator [Proteobacteria bacterium]|nr:response regulator [Pseudomonadota bacterium]